jgi:23S rRNA (cytosine1962-C5)-methyltransferase
MSYSEIILKKNEDKRLSNGHSWVFSNEVDTSRTPLTNFAIGELVYVKNATGKIIGTGYIHPNMLICARLLSHRQIVVNWLHFFKERLTTALILREKLYDLPYYRLVFGESDGLPGLVIDRFGAVFCIQVNTAGMELQKSALCAVLIDLFTPDAIYFKNDNSQRQLEGLSLIPDLAYGKLVEPLIIEENAAKFKIDILAGQKTGWFYDHRNSRARLASLAKNQRVLDLFSYTGAWGIPAAINGASEVTCVDASESALALGSENARLNAVADRMHFVRSDVFEYLKQARSNNQPYDIIVLDPPALIKRKKDFKQGFEAYRRLNQLALQLLTPNGILISASCSYHLSRENLHEILRSTAKVSGQHMVFFASDGQGYDHPVDTGMPETEYLKTFFCRVTPDL